MTVIDPLEQYVCPFLLACATLLVLLNTQRISGQNWTKPLARTIRIIIVLWRLHPAPQEFFTQNSQPLLSLMKLFKMKMKQNLLHIQFELQKVSMKWLLLLMLRKFMRSLISHLLILLKQNNTFESPILKKKTAALPCKHSLVIFLWILCKIYQ